MRKLKRLIKVARLRNQKLVLTLLVKNEADIIIDNIFFHYAKGVDFIIVTDNGSNDGTLEILKDLEREKLIILRQEQVFEQDKIVNEMGRIAKELLGATVLVHADADELWTPLDENKKLIDTFIDLKKKSVLVDRKDVLPTPDYKFHTFPQKEMNIVTSHLLAEDAQALSKKVSLFLIELPPKVMFSVGKKLESVGPGNHLLANVPSGEVTDKIIIYHFPFKSAERFKDKVRRAGHAIETVKTDKAMNWHWKAWYSSYKKGLLSKEIELLIPEMSDMEGITYEPFDYKKRVIDIIKTDIRRYDTYLKFIERYKDV